MAPPAPRSHARFNAWTPFVAGCVLVAATFAAYHNSFSGPLVYDDIAAIKENPTILDLSRLADVLNPPNDSGITVNGRPLINLTLAINYAIGGSEVAGYHVLNLVIHMLAALALFGILRRSLALPVLRTRFGTGPGATSLAFCTALLWAVHPLQTESVTYIIQRAESLVGLFYLLTLYLFVRSVQSARPIVWQSLAVLACLFGMASKEVMASAPLLVFVFDRTFVSGTFREAWRCHGKFYLGLAATWLLLAYLVAGTGNRGGTAGFGAGGVSSWHYALTSAYALGKYLKLTVWPDPLVFDYGVGLKKELLPVLPQGLLIVALVVGTAYALWKRPILGFLGLWCFAILGPSSSFIPVASEPMAEHRMYLPLAGLLTLAVFGLTAVAGKRCLLVFAALAVVAGALTVRRNRDYSDELILWRDTQTKYPTCERAHNNVGEILFRQEKYPEAIACFREAVRLNPSYTDAIINLGNSLTQRGQAADAVAHLELALRLRPGFADTYNNLGNAYYQLGRHDDAIASFREAIRLKPTLAGAYNNLGVVLTETGRAAEALPLYEKALSLKENYSDAHYNFGNALTQVGRLPDAIKQFRAALLLSSSHAEAHNNLGGVLFREGKLVEAKAHYEIAVRLKPTYADAQNNLGVSLFQEGKLTESLVHFAEAVKHKPDYKDAQVNLAEVHNNIGAAAFSRGSLPEAQTHFEAALAVVPSHAGAHNNLGVVLWRQGHLTRALPHLEEAVRLKPDFQDAVRGLQGLREQLRKAAN